MNPIYRVVFNAVTGVWQAVSETARGRSKSSRSASRAWNRRMAVTSATRPQNPPSPVRPLACAARMVATGIWASLMASGSAFAVCTGTPTVNCDSATNANNYTNTTNGLTLNIAAGAVLRTPPILGGGNAATLTGDNVTVNNSGTIDPSSTVLVSPGLVIGNGWANNSTIVVNNNAGGQIKGVVNLATLQNFGGQALVAQNVNGTTTIKNDGLISMSLIGLGSVSDATSVVAYGGAAANVTNTGTIEGRVGLGTSGGNTFLNAGTVSGSVHLGDSTGGNTFTAVSGSSVVAGGGSAIAGVITGVTGVKVAATGTVDAGTGSGNALVLQNSATAPGTGTGGAQTTVDWSRYINFQKLTIHSGTWNLQGAWSGAGTTTLNDGLVNFNNAASFGTGLFTANGGAIASSTADLNLANDFSLGGNLSLSGTNAFGLGGVLSGAGGLTVNNTGIVTLGGANLFTGGVNLNAGGLVLANADALGSGKLTVGGSATLNTTAGFTLVNNLVINGGGSLNLLGSSALSWNGSISGAGNVIKSGASTLTLNGASSLTGNFSLAGGSLTLGAGGSLSPTGSITQGAGTTLDLSAAANQTIGSLAGLGGTVNLGARSLTLGGLNTNTTFSGNINGVNGALVKVGTGTLTLSGANTFTGGVALNAGGLLLGNNSAIGSGKLTVSGNSSLDSSAALNLGNAITLNATLALPGSQNLTLDGVITGAGSLSKNGASHLTLNGNNTFSGGLTLNAGSLVLGNSGALGSGALNVGGNASLDSSAALSLANNMALGAGTTLSLQGSQAITLGGEVSGTGRLVKNGAATLTLNGANTFSGGVTLNAGGLVVGNDAALGTGAVFVGGNTTLDSNTAVTLANNFTLNAGLTVLGSSDLTLNGSLNGFGSLTKEGAATLTLNGANTYTGGTNINAGTLALGAGASLHAAGIVNLATGATFDLSAGSGTQQFGTLIGNGTVNLGANMLTIGDAGNGTFSGSIGGTGGLTKVGTGTETLTGANTYTGGTFIDAGTLAIGAGGSLAATGAVRLASGTTLDITSGGNQAIGSLAGVAGSTVALGGNTLTLGGNGNGLFAGTIVGNGNTGSLVKNGTGIQTLSGFNGFSGGVVLNAGGLVVGHNQALGTGTLSVGGNATLDSSAALTLGNAIAVAPSTTLTLLGSNALTLNGAISGGGGLRKDGAATVTLMGANTYTGGTTISGGTLALGSGGSLSATTALNVASGATLNIRPSGRAQAIGSLAGSGEVLLGTERLTVGGNNLSTTWSGTLRDTGTGMGLTKTGSGTWVIDNVNLYCGGTVIDGGTVLADASAALGSGDVKVDGASGLGSTLAVSSGVRLPNKITVNNGGTLDNQGQLVGAAVNGVAVKGEAGLATVTNRGGGMIDSGGAGEVAVDLTQGGAVTNTGAGTVIANLGADSGVRINGGPASVSNLDQGAISGGIAVLMGVGTTGASVTNSGGAAIAGKTMGVNMAAGGTITNSGTGPAPASGGSATASAISGGFTGVRIDGDAGTVNNSGGAQIAGLLDAGVLLAQGGTVSNDGAGSVIRGTTTGVNILGGAGTVSNTGGASINAAGAGVFGVNLTAGGTITNGVGSSIHGGAASVQAVGGATTLSNTGTLNGNVTLDGAAANRVTLFTGSKIYSDTGTTIGTADLHIGSHTASTLTLDGSGRKQRYGDAVTGATTFAGALSVQGGSWVMDRDLRVASTAIASGSGLHLGDGGTTGSVGTGGIANNGLLLVNRSDDLTLSNAVSGSGEFVKEGTNTVTLDGINASTGQTTVQQGTLQVGNGGTTGMLGKGAVTNNGTLAINRSDSITVANTLSGTGALVQRGTGTTVLAGSASYGGNTAVNAGALIFAGGATLSGDVNVATGAALGVGGTVPVSVSGTVNLANASILSISSQNAGPHLHAGNVSLDSGVGLNLSGISTSNELDRVLIATTGGISGDFAQVSVGGFSGSVDYMTLNTRKSADGLKYLANYALSWTANNSGAHGSFTLSNVTDQFTVGASLSNQMPNGALNWDGKSLTKNGAGTLILTGANSYTGSTTINGGTLQIGNASNHSTSGNLGTGTVINNGMLALGRSDSYTVGNNIEGTGGLSQIGTGTTVLTGLNSYQGGTFINGGTLQVDLDARLGAASGALSFNGGTLQTTANTSTQRQITLGANGGRFSPDAATTLTIDSGIQGTGSLTQAGAGTLVLTGSNSYGGATTIASGALQVGAGGAIGTLGTGAVTNNGVLSVDRSDAFTLNQSISGTGALQQVGSGTTTLTGSNSYTGGTVVVAGTLKAGSANALVQNTVYYLNEGSTLDLNSHTLQTSMLMGRGNVLLGSADLTVSSAVGQRDSFGGQIAGTGQLIKQGEGTLALNNASNFTGGVSLKQGRINLGHEWGLGTGNLLMDDGTALGLTTNGMTVANNLVMTGSNDPIIDTGANSATWAGAISGAGFLTKQGSGVLTLSSTANNYTGATNVAEGTLQAGAVNTFSSASAHNVATGAVLDLAGYSQTLSSLSNSGAVNLSSHGSGTPGAVLKLTGPYVGNNSTLGISTVLAADGSARDKLLLSGSNATASGSTAIQITNAGGLGAQTTGSGIQVVATENGASLQPGSFTLAGGHVDAGAYEYRLFQTAQGAALQSTNAQPGPNPDPSPVAYRSEVPLVSALPAQLRQADAAMLGDLRKRMGDDNVTGTATSGTVNSDAGFGRRAWGRILRTDPSITQQGTVSPQSNGHLTGFQAGLDLYASQSFKGGFYVGQLQGDMSVSGFAGGINRKYVGFNSLTSRYLGLYGTWQNASGLYADAVLQGADYRSNLHTSENTGAGASSVTNGSGVLASLELGQAFALGSHWQIEPQAQISYRSINLHDSAMSLAQVRNKADSDWTLRLGVRIKGSFATSVGQFQPYGRINVYKASNTNDVASVITPAATTQISAKGGYTATEMAAGASLQINPRTSVYGELGKLWANGGDSRVKSGVQASIGVRVQW